MNVNIERRTLKVQGQSDTMDFSITRGTKILWNGKQITLRELKNRQRVAVSYVDSRGFHMAREVSVETDLPAPAPPSPTTTLMN